MWKIRGQPSEIFEVLGISLINCLATSRICPSEIPKDLHTEEAYRIVDWLLNSHWDVTMAIEFVDGINRWRSKATENA